MTGALYSVNYEQSVFPLDYSLPWPGGVIAVSDRGTYLYGTPSDVNWLPKTEAEYTALAAQYGQMEFILAAGLTGQKTEEDLLLTDVEYRNQLICQFYADTYQRNVYMAEEEPVRPQESDLRIEEVTVLGETRVYEVTGQLLEVRQSRYYESDGWQEYSGHLVITIGIDNAYERVIGSVILNGNLTAEQIIQQKIHGLSDLEVSLFRDGFPWPVGPGSQIHIYREAYDGPETVEVLEGWEPIYQEGDYWAVRRWGGVETLCYYSLIDPQHGSYDVRVNTFDTTRTDLRTYRGICVGDSREKVQATYPELKSGDYWGKYPGEDYLWYCMSEQDFGAALIFFFENDAVSRIVLTDMFN